MGRRNLPIRGGWNSGEFLWLMNSGEVLWLIGDGEPKSNGLDVSGKPRATAGQFPPAAGDR
jgi:hypothetical protein